MKACQNSSILQTEKIDNAYIGLIYRPSVHNITSDKKKKFYDLLIEVNN